MSLLQSTEDSDTAEVMTLKKPSPTTHVHCMDTAVK